MIIFGTALLAGCYLAGIFFGDVLGTILRAKANVGGVGIAMMLLIFFQHWMRRNGLLTPASERGITFWGMMYIPVVVAMAATQNVMAAVKGGPIALIAAAGSVLLCACAVAFINRVVLRDDGKAWQPESLAEAEQKI